MRDVCYALCAMRLKIKRPCCLLGARLVALAKALQYPEFHGQEQNFHSSVAKGCGGY